MLSDRLERVILSFWEDLSCPFSLKCAILWRYGERDSVLRLVPRMEDFATPTAWFKAVQAVAIVKKLKGVIANDSERREATVKKWWEAEHSCYKANQRLYPYLPGTNLERDERISAFIGEVRKVVVELIGASPPSVLHDGRHGPGATFSDRGRKTTVPHKFASIPTLTPGSVWYLIEFFGTAWGAYTAKRGELSYVKGNRFTTVPKTSIIDRGIAIEPSINVFYQLALGRILRQRLRSSHGWDLDTASNTHKLIAERASSSREFATLDLSSASDTVAYNLVKLLLPRPWFEALDDLRSPYTQLEPTGATSAGKWVKLEKFSSMGNGYTFELETVIFAALCITTLRQNGDVGVLGFDTFVFGDDIIVPDSQARNVIAVLNWFGFNLNQDKSFWGDTPFRESCGADFWEGTNVRPSYLKEEPSDVQGCIGVVNRLTAAYDRLEALTGSRPRRAAYRHALGGVPSAFRHFGPKALGDSVIWAPPEKWRVRWRNSIRYVKTLKPGDKVVIPFSRFDPDVVLASALYGCGNVGTPVGGRVPLVEGLHPRDAVRSYCSGWTPYS